MSQRPHAVRTEREMVADYLQQQWASFLGRPLPRTEWLEEADEIIDIVRVQSHIEGTQIRRDQVEDLGPCSRCDGTGRELGLR